MAFGRARRRDFVRGSRWYGTARWEGSVSGRLGRAVRCSAQRSGSPSSWLSWSMGSVRHQRNGYISKGKLGLEQLVECTLCSYVQHSSHRRLMLFHLSVVHIRCRTEWSLFPPIRHSSSRETAIEGLSREGRESVTSDVHGLISACKSTNRVSSWSPQRLIWACLRPAARARR